MIEVPCTLRCDRCKETTSAIAEAKHVNIVSIHAFVITDNILPAGWQVVFDELRCPRCNGVR